MKELCKKEFANGVVYLLQTDDGYLIEVTDTFLPYYTKNALDRKENKLINGNLGSRLERYIIGVSVMSGCPVRCKFCATGKMKKWRNLTAEEIVGQVEFIVNRHPEINPCNSFEFKCNMTRMGEPFLNINEVKRAINILTQKYSNIHIFVSTIGIEGADYSWIKDNITLQVSLHSLDEVKRDWLIPYNRKVSIEELGQIRTDSNLKTTVNMTLVDESDFDINKIKKWFDTEKFFIKLSPINPNDISNKNNLGVGVIESVNIV